MPSDVLYDRSPGSDQRSGCGQSVRISAAVPIPMAAMAKAPQRRAAQYSRTSAGAVESVSCTADFTGLFFIGIFLGLLFLMATVLIMYYKQLTEGYEDKKTIRDTAECGDEPHRKCRKSDQLADSDHVLPAARLRPAVHVAFDFPFIFRVTERC